MYHVTVNDSTQTHVEFDHFNIGALEVSEHADLVAVTEAGLAGVKKAQQAVHEVGNRAQRLSGARSKTLARLHRDVVALHKAEAAHKATDEGRAHASVFAFSPAAISKMRMAERGKQYEAIDENLRRPGFPAALKAAAKRFSDSLAAYRKIEAAIVANDKDREAAARGLVAAKQANIAALMRVEGKLRDRHADDPEEVESYFKPAPKNNRKASKAEAQAAPPAATPPSSTPSGSSTPAAA